MKSLINQLLRRKDSEQLNDFDVYLDGNPGALRVLIFTEYINATYYISFDIPMRQLHAEGRVNLATVSQNRVKVSEPCCWNRWADTFQPDIVVMTRYGLPHGPAILDRFHQRAIPVVYHIDDDLLEVPDTLGAEIQQRQGADDVVQARRYLLANCDLIYASTGYLATTLQDRFPNQSIFQGIHSPYLGEAIHLPQTSTNRCPVVGYMGSKGHQRDLDLVVPSLERLLEERGALRFEAFGTIRMPHALERFGSRVRSWPVQPSYLEFLATLRGLGWHIGLAPLIDSPFTRCKSPTKFIEYTACGIPVAASRHPVYEAVIPAGGGILVDQDWYGAIVEYLDNPQYGHHAVAISRQYCASKFSPEVLQQQLIEVFKSAKNLAEKPDS
jgi:glycosyltransferase involved in cell wall biosynthesis